MAVQVWQNNDQGYFDWVTANRDSAWIANVYQTLGPRYFKVHRASHRLVYAPFVDQNASSYTGNQYAKVTANSLAELWVWADGKGMKASQKSLCRTCCADVRPPTAVATTTDRAELESRVRTLLSGSAVQRPCGTKHPKSRSISAKQYSRSPAVTAWVITRANGICECCGSPAPFSDASGFPFLEVHHIMHLAAGGPDTPINTAAVCPNCHRALHFANHLDDLAKSLGEKVRYIEAGLPDELPRPG